MTARWSPQTARAVALAILLGLALAACHSEEPTETAVAEPAIRPELAVQVTPIEPPMDAGVEPEPIEPETAESAPAPNGQDSAGTRARHDTEPESPDTGFPAPAATDTEPNPLVVANSAPAPNTVAGPGQRVGVPAESLARDMATITEPEPATPATVESPASAAPAVTDAPATGSGVPASAAPQLDLDGLETRLRKTKAIGMFTKLELKNQVEALLDDMQRYHEQRGSLSLEQLEDRFELLVMKLLLLLQDDDPQLHRAIADARPTLWTTLANPDQFASVRGP